MGLTRSPSFDSPPDLSVTPSSSPWLDALSVYPIKSLPGLDLASASLASRGLDLDRRFMVVSPDGHFLTQRELPEMARLRVKRARDEWVVTAPALPRKLVIPGVPPSEPPLLVTVWESEVAAIPLGPDADDFFTEALGTPARLVFMPESTHRRVDPTYAPDAEVGFADGFPLLLTSRASLDALNSRLAIALPMSRFRPNLIIDGCPPFAEDRWRRIQIGEVVIELVKPCTRCAIISTSEETGARDPAPLKALGEFRRINSPRLQGVLFGVNGVHKTLGTLITGNPVEVLEYQTSPFEDS